MSSDTRSPRPPGRWFWTGFFVVIGLGVLLVLFAAIRAGTQWVGSHLEHADPIPPAVTRVVRVTLSGGEAVDIDAAALERIEADAGDWLAGRREQVLAPLAMLEPELGAIHRAAGQQVPVFADWYFSLVGEYGRLFHAAAGDLSEYLAGQLERKVFAAAGTGPALERMESALEEDLAARIRLTATGLRNTLERLVREQGAKTPPTGTHISGEWRLGGQFSDQLAAYLALTPQDIARQGAAVSAGAGLSAAAAKKAGALSLAKMSTKLAAKQSAGLAAAATSKLGLKALGGAGTGAASGAALCAGTVVGAPLAPGCAVVGGLVAGVATWILVDKAVLEVTELVQREAFEAELRQALAAYFDELHTGLQTRYTAVADAALERMAQSIQRGTPAEPGRASAPFVPADAVRGRGSR